MAKEFLKSIRAMARGWNKGVPTCQKGKADTFKLSDERMRAIVDDCDDTAGMLIKESTLRYFIEKAVNDDREDRS